MWVTRMPGGSVTLSSGRSQELEGVLAVILPFLLPTHCRLVLWAHAAFAAQPEGAAMSGWA